MNLRRIQAVLGRRAHPETEPREEPEFVPYQYWPPPYAEVGELLYRLPDDELLAALREPDSEQRRRAAEVALQRTPDGWAKPDVADTSWIAEMAANLSFERGLIDLGEFRECRPRFLNEKAWTLPGHLRVLDLNDVASS